MSKIRRASPNGGHWEEQIFALSSGGNGKITDVEFDHHDISVTQEDSFNEHYFLHGTFTYHETHPFRAGRTRRNDVEFMYRPDSELFLLNSGRDDEIEADIIRAINSKLDEDAKIYPGINISRNNIWDFIQSASDHGQIRVLEEGEIVDVDELDLSSDEMSNKVVWDAELYFEHPETGERQFVIFSDELVTVPNASLLEIEFIIQILEENLVA